MAFVAPGILFGSLAGVFVDRWNRRRVLVLGNFIQAIIIPCLLLMDSQGWIWIVYIVVFLESTVSQFLVPAENALLPSLVDETRLISANSLNALNDNLARVVGGALGGILLGAAGFNAVVLIDAASYAAAAVLIAMVSVTPEIADQVVGRDRESQLTRLWREWMDGLRLVARDPLLRGLFIAVGIGLFGDAILSALIAAFVQDEAGFTAIEYGWVLAARGIGGIAGGLLIAEVGPRLSKSAMIYGGLVATGIFLLIMVLLPTLPLVLSLMVVAGPFLMAWIISTQTLLQQGTAGGFRGRVFGVYSTVSTVLMFVAAGLAGALADVLGVATLLIAAGAIYMAAGLVAWALLRRPLRALG